MKKLKQRAYNEVLVKVVGLIPLLFSVPVMGLITFQTPVVFTNSL